jgi:hypothetical protein
MTFPVESISAANAANIPANFISLTPVDWLAMKKALPQHGSLWIGVAGED